MKCLSFRLRPGQLLKEEMELRSKEHGIRAGVLLSVVGSLQCAMLRLAGSTPDQPMERVWNEPFEIVSGTGTFSEDGCHIHVSLSDGEGNLIGGHLKDGCVVKTTAEVVIGILEDVSFKRVFDKDTGFQELEITS
jgi:uncharacterized protein